MPGSGLLTRTVRTTTRRWRRRAASRGIHPWDLDEPREQKKTHRGGTFLCTDQYCSGYVVGTRGKGEVSTGTNHLGFRCVEDATTLGNGVSASHM